MNASYEATRMGDGDVFTNSGSKSLLAKVDAVVFDCDGTLIDVRDSYDATILKTTTSMLEAFFGRSLPLGRAGQEFILQIRRTGGFNSDWDITYALSLFSAAAMDGLGPDEDGAWMDKLTAIVADFASGTRLDGWRSVDAYMASAHLESKPVKDLRRFLAYPGNPLNSKMAATFDQVYYGEGLYKRIYGVRPEVSYEDGLIDSEKIIVTGRSLERLEKVLGGRRMAMATGRPFVAVEHTLKTLLGYFERDASVFIGDGDISAELAPRLSKFKKPSGESLVLARERLSSKVLLYVGDSAEDRLMVQNADAPRGSVLFAGVYGSSFNEKEQTSYFSETQSDLIVKNVNQIPEILEMARA